jgi:hypothetical protein
VCVRCIGAETVGTSDFEAEKVALIKKYKHPAIKDFLETPLRAAWHDLNLRTSLEQALDDLHIDVVDGLSSGHSVVPQSASVEISLTVEGEKIALLTSTRYEEESFVEFVERNHFKHISTVPSYKNKNYKQFSFRYSA